VWRSGKLGGAIQPPSALPGIWEGEADKKAARRSKKNKSRGKGGKRVPDGVGRRGVQDKEKCYKGAASPQWKKTGRYNHLFLRGERREIKNVWGPSWKEEVGRRPVGKGENHAARVNKSARVKRRLGLFQQRRGKGGGEFGKQGKKDEETESTNKI